MRLARLVVREIEFRRLNFALGVVSVAAAVACVVGQLTLLRAHDVRTERIIAAKQADTEKMMRQLEDDYRKITLKMGFNVLIIPEGQKLSGLYDDEQQPLTMPEKYAETLARSKVATINHVLPALTRRVKWPERQRKILLTGVRGEVLIHGAGQKPLLESVPAGQIILGHELHTSLNLKAKDQLTLMGRSFTVAKTLDERGNWDDATVWINLREAQEMLNCPGQITAILALECNCAADRLAQIRAEIGALLPNTQVIEFSSQAIARAEARNRAAAQAAASIEHEKTGRQKLRRERESFATVLVPIAVVASALWVALLILGNVRDRRPEIGILRALGLGARPILFIFVAKALFMGVVGALVGYPIGLLTGAWPERAQLLTIAQLAHLPLILCAAPLLAAVASWLPATLAAQQDPAVVLREE